MLYLHIHSTLTFISSVRGGSSLLQTMHYKMEITQPISVYYTLGVDMIDERTHHKIFTTASSTNVLDLDELATCSDAVTVTRKPRKSLCCT